MNSKVLIVLFIAFVCIAKALPVEEKEVTETDKINVETAAVAEADDLQTEEHRHFGYGFHGHRPHYGGYYGGYRHYPYYGGGGFGYPGYGYGGYPYYGGYGGGYGGGFGFGGYPFFF